MFADTYTIQPLDSDAGRSFYGMDDLGSVVFLRSGNTPCGPAALTCYETISGSLFEYSSTAPTLDWDYVKDACTFMSRLCSITNNGRSVEIASWSTVNYGPNLSQTLHGSGFGGVFAINGVGNILVDDEWGDIWYEIVDIPAAPVSAHALALTPAVAPVPELSSILFLGTGALALALARKVA